MATNLQFIKSASGSGVTSLSVTDCFTSDYNIYQIHTDYSSTTSTPFFLNMRLIDSGGNIITDSEYDKAELYLKSDASGVFKGKKYIGVHKVAETITGFHMYKAGTSGTSANITVNIYGVK